MSRAGFAALAVVSLLASGLAHAQTCPGAPTNLSPADGATDVPRNVTLSWSEPNATGFKLYLELDNAGCPTSPRVTITSNSFTPPVPLIPGASYIWKVASLKAGCPEVETTCRTFVAACTTATPQILSPVNGATNVSNPVTLSWSAVSGIREYFIFVSGNGVDFTGIGSTFDTSLTWSAPNEGLFYWYVQAAFDHCPPKPSDVATFRVGACNSELPTLLAPANNATNVATTVEFSWTQVPGASNYKIWASLDGSVFSLLGETSGDKLQKVIAQGKTVTWYVEAISPACPSRESVRHTFTTAACQSPAALLVRPVADGQVGPSVEFVWSQVPNATEYKLWLVALTTSSAPAQIFRGTATSFQATLNPGLYDWYVETLFADCPPSISEKRQFSVLAPCNNAAPTLVSPSSGASLVSPVEFIWNPAANATGYSVLYSVDGGANAIAGSTTGDTHLTAPVPKGTISWFVEARFRDCPPTFSTRSTFTVTEGATCQNPAPLLLTPANGATGLRSPIELTWSAVENAIEYRVFAAIGTEAGRAIGVTTGTRFVASFPAGSVVWWVEALFKDCPPVASTVRFGFSVASGSACENPAPTLVSPADGATNLTSPVTLFWSAVAGVEQYRVWAAGSGTAPAVVAVTPATTVTLPAPRGTIEWFVEAQFRDCPSTFSKHATFTISSGSCPTVPPVLRSPADGAANVSSPVSFEWGPVTGAVQYNLYLGVDGAAPQLFASTRSETELTALVPAGAIEWYVEAIVKDCPSLPSPRRRFTVAGKIVCSEAAPLLLSPANGAQNVASPVTLSWSAVADATAYKVWAAEAGSAPIAIGATSETTLARALPSGTIEWFVEALFRDCPSTLSPHFKFTVAQGANCAANVKPVLIAPANNAALASPSVEFVWNPVANAAGYKLWASLNGAPHADIAILPATQTRVTRELPRELRDVTWFVEAFFGGCPSLESDRFKFTIAEAACPSAKPVLVAPVNVNVPSPVTFSWSSVPGALFYRTWIVADDAGVRLLAEGPDTSVQRPIPSGSYEWYVETFFKGCKPTRSDSGRFSVPQSSSCGSDRPVLVSPANGATDLASPVSFFWSPLSGAVAYQLWIVPESGSPAMIGATESTTLERPLPAGKYEWFIRAFFPGCPETESVHATFTVKREPACEIPRPIVLSPPDGSLNLLSPVEFAWTRVERATGYRVFASIDGSTPTVIGTTAADRTTLVAAVPAGRIVWLVQAIVPGCEAIVSKEGHFSVAATPPPCGTPEKTVARSAGEIPSGYPYPVYWTPIANSKLYEIQESATPDFADAATLTVTSLAQEYSHEVTRPTVYFYRVRAVSSCNDERGPYSDVIRVVVVPPPPPTSREVGQSAPAGGSRTITHQLFIPGSGSGKQAFNGTVTVSTDKSWLTVTPSTVTVPPQGTTVMVSANPGALPLGTSTGTVTVSGSTGSVTTTTPVSVSLVSPVAPAPKSGPPPNALIVPAVAHAAGLNSQFESDVRVTNTSAQTIKYQVNFTPSGNDATKTGNQSTIEIAAGQTLALDDILKSFFGLGSTGESATGTLELRPLDFIEDVTKGLATVGSSRTYNTTPDGTYGQFIPAIPFASFVGKNVALSLQQVSQSETYRTNFGLVEGSGESATVLFSVFNTAGQKLKEFSRSLKPGEHVQYNLLLQTEGVALADGRVEVKVTSDTGKITAYASVVDNRTADPLLVSPVAASSVQATKLVVPGVADLTNALANWRTDMRIFNGGATPVTATLTYYPQGAVASPRSATVTLAAGEVKVIDNALQSLFSLTNSGGAMHVTTPTAAPLVVTARTYDSQIEGTYGQFIPAIAPEQATALGARTLQVLQLEESPNFRTNLGLAEVSGAPATVELTAIVPDSTVSLKYNVELAANEFKQVNQVLKAMGLGTTYNARVAVKVINGSGKVTAYGSVIDNRTQDPTYVPSQ